MTKTDVKALIDLYQERIDYIKEEITSLPTAQKRMYATAIRRTLEDVVADLSEITSQ